MVKECQDRGRGFVEACVDRMKKNSPRSRSRSTYGLSLVTALLALGVLLTTTGTGLAISGLASPGPAVQAQYPDARGQMPDGQAEQGPLTFQGLGGGSGQGGQTREQAQREVAREFAAVRGSAEPSPQEYMAIPLLLSGIGVLAAATVVRYRRGPLEQQAGLNGLSG
jgi:hypothetical protein